MGGGGGGGAIFTLGTLFLFILFIHPAQIAMYYVCPPPQNEIASYAYANTCIHVCTLTSAIYIKLSCPHLNTCNVNTRSNKCFEQLSVYV